MQNTGSIVKNQEMTQAFLVKIFLVVYSIVVCIDINLSKTVPDDFLQYEKIEKWGLL